MLKYALIIASARAMGTTDHSGENKPGEYPAGSCGANMWDADRHGNSKCPLPDWTPYPSNDPQLHTIMGDSQDMCCKNIQSAWHHTANGGNDRKATKATTATDYPTHDPTKCNEHSKGSHDDDCCGVGNAIWCADDYWMVTGWENNDGCWPGGKGYKCVVPPTKCSTEFMTVTVENPLEIQTKPTTHHEGGHYGESEDATQAWYGKQIMFDKPNSYNVKYKVTFAAATTVYGLTSQYDAGATLKWRKHGDTAGGSGFSNECYATNGNKDSYCNVPSNEGVSGTVFDVEIESHHSEWNWFGNLEFKCSEMPSGAQNGAIEFETPVAPIGSYPVGSCGANMWGADRDGNSKCNGAAAAYPEGDAALHVIGDDSTSCCTQCHSCPSPPTTCEMFHRYLSQDGGCAATCPSAFIEPFRILCDTHISEYESKAKNCGIGTYWCDESQQCKVHYGSLVETCRTERGRFAWTCEGICGATPTTPTYDHHTPPGPATDSYPPFVVDKGIVVCASTKICVGEQDLCLRTGSGADLVPNLQASSWTVRRNAKGFFNFAVKDTDDTYFGIDGHDGQTDCRNNMFTGDRNQENEFTLKWNVASNGKICHVQGQSVVYFSAKRCLEQGNCAGDGGQSCSVDDGEQWKFDGCDLQGFDLKSQEETCVPEVATTTAAPGTNPDGGDAGTNPDGGDNSTNPDGGAGASTTDAAGAGT